MDNGSAVPLFGYHHLLPERTKRGPAGVVLAEPDRLTLREAGLAELSQKPVFSSQFRETEFVKRVGGGPGRSQKPPP
ncbi:MAG: hypothetical protein A2655_01215 [Candidatus Yanofskybacteria bacterium RIFCSPHIGHO2_01_FULL_43_42]|uniref:Uncharacterized protein n=1 Tax=Candidatus Yanofskybacteria bacterium RIFCSPLOWO2_01_FULL_43_22 TaxID=1802695 RepID=A0A1F8GEI6_9BACT|nr:MAG: hypothetical protein A2655_01215 [Candidatus Yanofskybacteria bacterium RIFCSPHIGHO2_01_FULL_43_42]OGN13814.1 MAG: hypothetical protein A3D48_00485 [Candidatus Yanofskybacteria bacterium RIFCSPHIGHO2_02_FULL_43_17]OGN23797.1 MAG: hypothetical protein A3A13_02000 [Candidatus Yanofskybacteria bacterium RIFCSPLOWO2_01_FULL_43_22]